MGATDGAVLAVDMGGTSIKGAIVDRGGERIRELTRPTPVADGPAAVIAALEAVVAELAVGDDRPGELALRAVAVVVPGIVDADAGRVVFAANLGLRDAALRDRLQAITGLETVVDHDVRAAGLAERTVGAARGSDDHVVAVIGTGIAAVVVTGGVPVRGAAGIAGELGHVPVWPDGEPCPCGQRGCLERYASAAAIARRYTALGGQPGTSTREVAARRTRDPAAAQAWREACEALAIGLATCTLLLDPALIVLSGGLSDARAALLEPVRAELTRRCVARPVPELRLSPLGGGAGLAGAAVLAWRAAGSLRR